MNARSLFGMLLVLAGVGMWTMRAQAAVLVQDNFGYSGPLTSNGWSAYSGADGSITSDTTRARIGGGTEDIRLSFADQLTGPTYASFTMNVAALPASGSIYSFGYVDATTMESRFGILSVGGTAFRLTAWAGQGTAALATNNADLSFNTDYLVTYYFDGVDDHRLWIDSDGADFASPDIQATGANNGIDGVFIRQASPIQSGAATWFMSNLVVGTTFADVTGGAPSFTNNIYFSSASASVSETGVSYVVTIEKSPEGGTISGEISLAGTATEGLGNDYTISGTNFTLNGATTSATFTVTVNNDAEAELSETVILGLANVTGAGLLAPNQFTLTIVDDDAVPVTGLIISQYTESDTGTLPKGIEVWNNTGAPITFDSTINKLEVKVGSNGGTPNSAVIVTNGTLGTNEVWVIGTTDMSPDILESFTYNGNDAVVLEFGGFVVDVIGTVGNDPGVAWTNNGVSTKDQNIQLKTGITTGDADGWLDPSERFEAVSVGSVLTGFGTAPGETPIIPTNVTFSIASDAASEDAGLVEVIITKSLAEGNVSGEVTLGGTATEGLGNDYTLDTTNFTLNGATTSATITVTINDDVVTEGPETVILTLANVVGGTIAAPSTYTLTIQDDDTPPAPTGGLVWINELDYDNIGTDSNEFFEIAGPAGTDLSPYSIYLYNGGNGLPYRTNVLSGVIDDEGCGFGAVSFFFGVNDAIQNGAPDAVALVSNGVTVLQFLGYEGSFIASGGPAVGLTAIDIGVADDSVNDIAPQLAGSGDTYAEFGWTNAAPSPGSLNTDQAISPCGGTTTNISFSSASAFLGEQGIGQTVYVVKSLAEGDVSGQIAISGTATEGAGNDFTVSTTNFTLNGTTTSNIIIISVNNDAEVESNETVVLTLVNVVGGTLVAPTSFTLTIIDNDVPPLPNGPVWINELDYDNIGTDSNEFFEIAGPAGTDLSPYSIYLYNGSNGQPYRTNVLSGVIDDEGCGFGAVSFFFGVNDVVQNGAPDAIALVSNGVTVIQFLSYEGSFSASGGPASGLTSIDIGVADDSVNDIAPQLAGTGDTYAEFGWTNAAPSPGSLNVNQAITGCTTVIDEPNVTDLTIAPGLVSVTIPVTSNGVPYSLLFTTNLLTAPVPTGTADTEIATGGPVTLQDASPTEPEKHYWIRTND